MLIKRVLSPLEAKFFTEFIGGSSELSMWLILFLVTIIGHWRGTVHIYINSHVEGTFMYGPCEG